MSEAAALRMWSEFSVVDPRVRARQAVAMAGLGAIHGMSPEGRRSSSYYQAERRFRRDLHQPYAVRVSVEGGPVLWELTHSDVHDGGES